MAARWLLIELFGGKSEPYSVIGLGRTPKQFMSLDAILHHRATLAAARSAIDEVVATRSSLERGH
ncbi:GAF domain-containing protein [Nocardia sp. BMG111209]|uniref:GAF domain-containing protein n=1 Tax=Nocardia sp. BMG111209 TaxID=1160137 RepID=UPI00037192D1|nr:GAF domain-containing protein [Nocardia sp. BMG111209]